MIVLWLAISTIALLCGISVGQQITANLRKYKKGAYELSTKITNHPMRRCLKLQIRPHLSFQDCCVVHSKGPTQTPVNLILVIINFQTYDADIQYGGTNMGLSHYSLWG